MCLTDPLLQLISLQKATGSWEMDSSMAKVLEKSDDELAKLMPVGVKKWSYINHPNKPKSYSNHRIILGMLNLVMHPVKAVWATTLALIWLYGLRLEAQEEWQFVAMKAASWIQAQKGKLVSSQSLSV